ncbi:hypothetical protein D3C86_2032950 [compost metagenome]
MMNVAVDAIRRVRLRPIRSLSRPPMIEPTMAQALAIINSVNPACLGIPRVFVK